MRLLSFLVIILLSSCTQHKKESLQNKEKVVKKECVKTQSKKFEMYEMSEMAMLMEQMYADNERLRQRILSGENVGQFPQHFLKIHKAVMSDDKDNDAFFKEHANAFIASQEKIFKNQKMAKDNFNTSIDECVKCHEVKCGGPLVRIKKLYIK